MIGTYALLAVLASSQQPSREALLAEGIRLSAMQPAEAVTRFDALLQRDSLDVEAGWRAAIARSDVALPIRQSHQRAQRDSLLLRAEASARRAVRLAPNDVHALFALGLVLGNAALTRGVRERVRNSTEIRSLALRAVAADSSHDGAQHLLGRWHYEIMRLSGVERFVAKTVLGGKEFGAASWEEAERRLRTAARLAPGRIYHRLVLARILRARDQLPPSRTELERIIALPDQVAADTTYRREALELLDTLRDRQP
jgi:tetratricopeptide (TPR) repeat protein